MGTNVTNNTPSLSSLSTPSPSSTTPSLSSTLITTSGTNYSSAPYSTTFPFTTSPSSTNRSNQSGCDFRGKSKIEFVPWGYEQIPQNLTLNVVAWLSLLLIFSCLRRKAWNHGHLALLKRISKRGSNQSRGGEQLLREEEEPFEDAPHKNSTGYNPWVSLFYDPERRFSVAPPSGRPYRMGTADIGSQPQTPTGSVSMGSRGGGAGWPPTPNPAGGTTPTNQPPPINVGAAGGAVVANGGGGGAVPSSNCCLPVMANGSLAKAKKAADGVAAVVDAGDVKIRVPPLVTNGAPSALPTLLRGDGQLHTANFSFSNPRGFFGWIRPIFKLKDKDYREVAGQDAVNYLNFQRYCIVYLAIVTLLSCCVILWINVHGDLKRSDQEFGKTTISNLPPDDSTTWWHAWIGLSYLGMAVVFMKNYMSLLELSDEEAEHSKKTVMIRNINPESCNRQTIIQHFSETFPECQIQDVQAAHDIGGLIQLDYERERAIDAREVYADKFEKTSKRPTVRPYCCGDRFGCCCPCVCGAVDAIGYYEDEIDRIEKQYEEERSNVYQKNLGLAFVTFLRKKNMVDVVFEHARMNTLFARLKKTKFEKAQSSVSDALHVQNWKVAVAPTPQNICWENLGTKPAVWWTRCILLNLVFVCVMTGASTPAHIVTLLDTWNVTSHLNLPTLGPVVLSQFLPTWLLWLFAVTLPVLIYYVAWFEGHETKSVFNHSVMLRSYLFLLTMLLFLPSISLTSFETAAAFFLTKNLTTEELSQQWGCIFLPHNGAFFVNYVTTAAFVGTGMELCRFPELFMYSMRLLSARSAAERHTVKKNQPYSYDYGNHYAWFLTIFAITMAYSISCPLVTPFGLIYAILKHAVDRHNIYFAYDPAIVKKDLHVTATNFMILAVIFTQCNLLFFQLWRSSILHPLTIFTVIAVCISSLVFMGWVSWGWFDNIAQNKYKRWMGRFPKQSIADDSSIMNDSDISSPVDDDEDDELEDNFVFVPRQPSCINPAEANDSIADNYSVEEASPFNSDVAVRRRTMERLDSVISVGSRRSSVVNPLVDGVPSSVTASQPLRSIANSATYPDRIARDVRPLSGSTVSTRSSMRMPKLSVTSSLDFDERDEEDFFDPGGRQRRSGSGMPAPRPLPSPTQQPSSVSGSLPTTPSFAGVTNYGATDASDYPIAHRPSIVVDLELHEQAVLPSSPGRNASSSASARNSSEAPSPSATSSSSIAAENNVDNSKSKSSSSRSQTPAPDNEAFEE